MSNRRPLLTDFFAIYCLIGLFIGCLFLLASCRTVKPRPDPLWAILPPGFTPPPSNQVQASFNATKAVLRTAQRAIGVPVTMTFDQGSGTADGLHVFAGWSVGNYFLVQTFPYSNQFTVMLPTNAPCYVEVRTFWNWPSPGVIGSYTNADGTLSNFTNYYRESDPAWMIFVPTNCPTIGLFQVSSGMVLAGWNAGTNLTIQASQDLRNWSNVQTVTNVGSFQLRVDGEKVNQFWRWSALTQ